MYIPIEIDKKKTLGVVDTAAQVSVMSKNFYDKLIKKPSLAGRMILKGAGATWKQGFQRIHQFRLEIQL